MIGNANLKLKRNDAAISAYKKAATLDPNPAVAYFNSARRCSTSAETVKTLPLATRRSPPIRKKADAYFVKGSACSVRGVGQEQQVRRCRPAPWKR